MMKRTLPLVLAAVGLSCVATPAARAAATNPQPPSTGLTAPPPQNPCPAGLVYFNQGCRDAAWLESTVSDPASLMYAFGSLDQVGSPPLLLVEQVGAHDTRLVVLGGEKLGRPPAEHRGGYPVVTRIDLGITTPGDAMFAFRAGRLGRTFDPQSTNPAYGELSWQETTFWDDGHRSFCGPQGCTDMWAASTAPPLCDLLVDEALAAATRQCKSEAALGGWGIAGGLATVGGIAFVVGAVAPPVAIGIAGAGVGVGGLYWNMANEACETAARASSVRSDAYLAAGCAASMPEEPVGLPPLDGPPRIDPGGGEEDECPWSSYEYVVQSEQWDAEVGQMAQCETTVEVYCSGGQDADGECICESSSETVCFSGAAE